MQECTRKKAKEAKNCTRALRELIVLIPRKMTVLSLALNVFFAFGLVIMDIISCSVV